MRYVTFLFLALLFGTVGAQELDNPNKLKPCPQNVYDFFDNCWAIMVDGSGNGYIGEFRHDKRHGLGMYTDSKGTYIGEFRDGVYHGSGEFLDSGGRKFIGIFENGNFIRDAQVNLVNLINNVPTNSDGNDIDRERQDLAEERRRLQEEKRQQQAENKKDRNQTENSIVTTDNRRRFALVIGNGNYNSLPKLPNAVNDARVITQSLRSAGFQVSTHENLDLAGMQNSVRSFGEKLGKNDVGLVYYAGHGVQVKGKNYLIPVKENIKKSFEVPSSAVDVDLVLATLENIKNDLNIVVLDACRSSFPGEARGVNRGLANIEAAKGTFIAFATAPGKEALDGSGSNSPYTKHLAKLIGKKGVLLEQVFKEVRKAVVAETNGEQVPWENSSLMGDFYFQK
jgi:hypothetical protein